MIKWKYPLEDRRDLAVVELYVRKVASEGANLSAERSSQAVLVSLELASNAIKYGGGGLFELVAEPGTLKITVSNRKADPSLSEKLARELNSSVRLILEGEKSSKSLGAGLYSVRKYSNSLRFSSTPTGKLKVEAVIASQPPGEHWGLSAGIAIRPYPGEVSPGDTAVFKPLPGERYLLLAADIAGHGKKASTLAKELKSSVLSEKIEELPQLFNQVNRILVDTRGGAVFGGIFSLRDNSLSYFNYGNLKAYIYRMEQRTWSTLTNTPAIFGKNPFLQLKRYSHPFSTEDTFFLHSDGVQLPFGWEKYHWLHSLHPAKASEKVVALMAKNYDDSMAVLIRALPKDQ